MALKAIVDSLDAIPEAVRGEYTPRDGKFFLAVEPVNGYELEDVTGLKNSLASERSVTAAVSKELTKFGSVWDKDKKQWVHSIDPIKAKQAIEKYDEFMSLDPAKEADKIVNAKVESTKQQLMAQHQQELTPLSERNKRLEGTITNILVGQTARAEIIAAKGVPELLIPHIERFTRVVEEGDDFVVRVIDDKGNTRIGDAKGNPMTVAQLVAEMRTSEIFGRAFEGEGNRGSGKQPGSSGGGNLPLKRSQMSAKQKADYQTEHGVQAFLKLPRD